MQTDHVEDEVYVPIELKIMIEAAEEPVEVVPQEPVTVEAVEPVEEQAMEPVEELAVEPAPEPEIPPVDTEKSDMEEKITKYKKKLRMEKDRIQDLETTLAHTQQELKTMQEKNAEFITGIPTDQQMVELEEQLKQTLTDRD